jgi:hypothetical protein
LLMALEFHGATGSMIRALIAEGQSDPEIAQAFRNGYVLARREQGVELVKRAIDANLIRKADPNTVLDLLYAPLYYRLLVGHQPLSDAFIREHVALALGGIALKHLDRPTKRTTRPAKRRKTAPAKK